MTRDANSPTWWPRSAHALAGFVSGVLLMLPGVFPVLAPVQVVAFVPLLVVLRRIRRWPQCLHAGLLTGLGFVAPQILLLRLPPLITLILVLYFVVVLTVLVVGSWVLFRPTGLWGCLAFGAFVALLDWVTVTALPMWGTAQSFVRCWSSYPGAIAFTSVTGMPGVIFVLAAIQALAVDLALDRHGPRVRLAVLVGLLVGVGAVDLLIGMQKPTGHLKVAAIGWAVTDEEEGMGSSGAFDRLYAEPVARAAQQGARLVAVPETALAIYDDPARDPFATHIGLAREHNVYLAIGYLDTKSRENRVAFIGPTEGVMGRYAKVHLTPFEDNPTGTGQPALVGIDGVSVGVMICHDDNYTDISRRYGQAAADIVVVPTNDWGPVRRAHLQSSIHRAIESRYAIVRAASNGISAIVAPGGRRLASLDHFASGPGVIVADVPVYEAPLRGNLTKDVFGVPYMPARAPRTVFSRLGHWFVWGCLLVLIAHVWLERGRLRRTRRWNDPLRCKGVDSTMPLVSDHDSAPEGVLEHWKGPTS